MSVVKEYYQLRKHLDRLTYGQVSVREEDWDSSRLDKFKIVIKPNAGFYEGGAFVFLVRLDENYPSSTPPFVYCETEVYHPNISYSDPEAAMLADYYEDYESPTERSNVCINLLTEGIWNPSYGLESIVTSLLFLMHNPNFEDPLAIEFAYLDKEKRAENIRKYMAGEEIDGVIYETNFKVGKESEPKEDRSIAFDAIGDFVDIHSNKSKVANIKGVCVNRKCNDVPVGNDSGPDSLGTANTYNGHVSNQDCNGKDTSSDPETSEEDDSIILKKAESVDKDIDEDSRCASENAARQHPILRCYRLPLSCS